MEPSEHETPQQTINLELPLHSLESYWAPGVVYIWKTNNDGSEMAHRTRAGDCRKILKTAAHCGAHDGNLRARRRTDADPDGVETQCLACERAYVSGPAQVLMLTHQKRRNPLGNELIRPR
jgi:hypothetical protein